MPRKALRRGAMHITHLCNLIKEGAEVQLVYKKIAGLDCKQYTIGGQYKLIATTRNNKRAQLFMGDYGKDWVNTGLQWNVCLFLVKLLEFREFVFYDEFKNKSQEGTTNNSLG